MVGGLRAAPAQISVSIDFRGKVYIGVRIFLLSAAGGGRGGWCGRGCCARGVVVVVAITRLLLLLLLPPHRWGLNFSKNRTSLSVRKYIEQLPRYQNFCKVQTSRNGGH